MTVWEADLYRKNAGGNFVPVAFTRRCFSHRCLDGSICVSKIAVIDGKIGYVGGFNIGKEYLGLDEKFGYWRDTHLRLEGASAAGLQLRFILDWNYAARENLLYEE